MTEYVHPTDCFVCGTANPHTLGMRIEAERGTVRTTCTIPDGFHGFPGYVHGGVIAAILDETMGALVGYGDRSRLTKTMELRFRRPVHTGVELIGSAELVDEDERSFRARGELRHASDGTVRAIATAHFVLGPPRPDQP